MTMYCVSLNSVVVTTINVRSIRLIQVKDEIQVVRVVIVRNVISGLRNQSDPRPDWGRLSCMTVGSLSRSATIKGGQVGARKPTFTVFTVSPQTLAIQSDRECAEARGTTHYASATDRRPPTPNRDRHRHHVVLLVGSRYIYIIPRL
jgi:hypothetical protein